MKENIDMLDTVSRRSFNEKFKKRTLEDIVSVRIIERMLCARRGYVFRNPKKTESVVLLLSGGLDSVTCWGILMKEFGLNVYPLSFDRGEKRANKEKAAIDYFSKLYRLKFPRLYHRPLRLDLGVQPISIPIERATKKIHPSVVMENFSGKGELMGINTSFGSFLILPLYAKAYAEYLYTATGNKIKSIYCAVTTDDGLLVPHQTFTTLRSIMYYICSATGDYSWQFTSAVFERENGLYYSKADLVRWAVDNDIPLEHSWTCYHSKKYQCGGSDCITCRARTSAFARAGIVDKTIYRSIEEQMKFYFIKLVIRRVIKTTKKRLKSLIKNC